METVDTYNLRRVILESPKQFADGFEVAKNIYVSGDFDRVMISGMGGSALPGNILRTFLNDVWEQSSNERKRIEIYQNRFYSLPPEAFNRCLNLICSHSGNTEETISAFEEALERSLPCVGISSGGKIEQMCVENNIPHVKLPVPFENFQPRAATGHFFAAIYRILINAGVIDDKTFDILESAKALEKEVAELENRGKELATRLKGKTPVIYTSTKYKSLAMIWKIKMNENAKTPAFWNFFPELNHNEMVGFTLPQAPFFIIMLRDKEDNIKNVKRYEVTADLLRQKGVEVEVLDMPGGNVYNKLFQTLYLGDWVSYYLALEYAVDPTPVDMVEDLKKLLA